MEHNEMVQGGSSFSPEREHAFLRHVLFDRTWCMLPVTVLRRSDQFVVIRISCGSEWLAACDYGSWLRIDDLRSWQLRPKAWTVSDLTYLIPFGAWCAYGMLRRPHVKFPHQFYINFQRPLRQTEWGFETLDLELDLVSSSSSSGTASPWLFKDTDRFEYLLERGVIEQGEGTQVRLQAEKAIELFESYRGDLLELCAASIPPPSLEKMIASAELPRALLSSSCNEPN